MPRAVIEGDHIRITGVRNFEYQSRNEFTVRYEERELQLTHLTGSCTINIIRYANAAGREGRFDFRHLLNGLIDSQSGPCNDHHLHKDSQSREQRRQRLS